MPLFSDPYTPNNIDCAELNYCHQFIPGDNLRAQFYQTPCGNNEICDPDFTDVTLGADLLGGSANPISCPAAGWTLNANWACSGTTFVHTVGSTNTVTYGATGMTVGNYYRVEFTLTRTAGSIVATLGTGAGSTSSADLDATGTYSIDLYFGDIGIGEDDLSFEPTSDFDGYISAITLKEVTYACWTPSTDWNLSDEGACKTIAGTDPLTESIANYITPDAYYQLSFTVSSYVSGSFTVTVGNVTDQQTTTIEANGNYTLYFEPTATGVITFTPSSDFIGCIVSPDLRTLKNDYIIQIVEPSSETALYEIPASYFRQYVTFEYDIQGETLAADGIGLDYGCYNIYVYDSCLTTGAQLAQNGNFSSGLTDWTVISGNDVTVVANQLQVVFDPIGTGTAVTVANPNFSPGLGSWTNGGGWSSSGGGALHTPGSTATLSQSITLLGTPANTQIWVQFTITGRTAGSVRVTIGTETSASFTVNDTITCLLADQVAGAYTFAFVPTTDFDGTVDTVVIAENYNISGVARIDNTANPLIEDGNYQASVDYVSGSTSITRVGAGFLPSGMASTATIGTITNTYTNYVPGSQVLSVSILMYQNTGGFRYYPGTYIVDSVSLVRVAPFEATYVSECFQYRETLPKSKVFIGYCDEAAFGFEYTNSGFRLFERVVCRSFAPSYEKDKKVFNYGSGVSGVYYSEVTKWYGVYLDAYPETVHDTIALTIDCDHFLIGDDENNNVEYVAKPDDYSPEWDRSGMHSLATVRFEVKPKEDGQVFSRNC